MDGKTSVVHPYLDNAACLYKKAENWGLMVAFSGTYNFFIKSKFKFHHGGTDESDARCGRV